MVGFLGAFVGELEEQQVGELFQVVAVTHAIVPQGVAEVPDFLDEGAAIHFDSPIGALTQVRPIARLPGEERESQPARNGGRM